MTLPIKKMLAVLAIIGKATNTALESIDSFFKQSQGDYE